MNKDLLALAFKRVGGHKSFLDWAHSNKRAFFSMFGKEILQDMLDVPHAAPPDPEVTRGVIEHALLGIVRANQRANLSGDKPASSVTMIEHDGVRSVAGAANPHVANRPGRDGNFDTAARDIPHTPHVIADTPEALMERPLLESKLSKPDVTQHAVTRKPPPSKAEVIPGLGAAQALEGRSDGHQPSATELFYSWSGHARPTWSPPRDWSGS